MSQSTANPSLPPASSIRDWTVIPDEAIQLVSDDDQEVTDAKFMEHQCQKKVWQEQRAAAEAAECKCWEREETICCKREEAEHREKEETECQKREEAEHWQQELAERMQERVESLVGGRARWSAVSIEGTQGVVKNLQVPVRGKGKELAQVEAPVGPCTQCACANTECTFELAKEQCKLLGGSKEVQAGSKVGKRMLEDQTSLRAGEKKKQVRAKSPEVEVIVGYGTRILGVNYGKLQLADRGRGWFADQGRAGTVKSGQWLVWDPVRVPRYGVRGVGGVGSQEVGKGVKARYQWFWSCKAWHYW
ncbi:hypothetical protein PISMIDRAFT_25730 [Pisolithus microcarpus 441]|uniref:Uncharacterized protein n=1 Tax=Pisolithus microcarpus 441 TaxID=765257 RepID=A0A0C9YNH6_9AGAM|nr:hypothetical protein PISMIDRAFT_25730 [Pisolithus microcarpus 441]